MPYYRRRRTTRKRPGTRRSYRSAYRRKAVGTVRKTDRSAFSGAITIPGIGFPPSLFATLRFSDLIQPANAISNTYAYVLNGLYDQRNAVGGAQPTYFDTYMEAYLTYAVLKSWINVEFWSLGNTDYWFGMTVSRESASNLYSSIVDLRSDSNCLFSCVVPSANTDGQRIKVKRTVDVAKMVALNPMYESILQGSVSANPSEPLYLRIAYGAMDGATAVQGVQFIVTLTSKTYFSDRQDVNQS